jgi:hypothetical protein
MTNNFDQFEIGKESQLTPLRFRWRGGAFHFLPLDHSGSTGKLHKNDLWSPQRFCGLALHTWHNSSRTNITYQHVPDVHPLPSTFSWRSVRHPRCSNWHHRDWPLPTASAMCSVQARKNENSGQSQPICTHGGQFKQKSGLCLWRQHRQGRTCRHFQFF